MNIRWFSPLDSEKTEIGRYSQTLLPHLHRQFALSVVADCATVEQKFSPESPVPGMRPIDIYNIGNSYMHRDILRMAMRDPGVVILHDVCLLELGLAYARYLPEWNLSEMVANEYNFRARKAFDALFHGVALEWCGESQQQYDTFVTTYPLFETFVKNAYGIVVHSNYALEKVKQKYKGPVLKLDLPYEAPQIDTTARHYNPPLEIVFCGHAGPNRRLHQFLDAWGQASRPDYFRLSLFGNINKADELLSHAESLGLAQYINVVGFVDDKELDRALSRAHLALNLRNPTMGETSASQLRYWANAIPSIVSDVGWYAELPDNVVMKVSLSREQEDITALLEKIISGNQNCAGIGISGYRYLRERHNVQRYVDALVTYVEYMAKCRFVTSIFDERLIGLIASMCRNVDDSKLFDGTLSRVVGLTAGLLVDEGGSLQTPAHTSGIS
jgi:glycosyltransferase involved in cell wall biosynthesis